MGNWYDWYTIIGDWLTIDQNLLVTSSSVHPTEATPHSSDSKPEPKKTEEDCVIWQDDLMLISFFFVVCTINHYVIYMHLLI